MTYFNAFQLVALFAAGPFLITYVKDAEFYAHTALFWLLVATYLVGFANLVAVVGEQLEKK